ncbi:hypothetical protein TIFTF001_002511 [Ficus carica]|uniref:HVA22-like protein n=1 Tax=Ficus carica TaxID=3494 RepID=A0AA88D7W7_FICCA|nr:hypothetical protein TIFTF001_002511 [Ficus carica]
MALLGSNISSEVGLRILLCPLGSNIVVRTACCSVGIALPVYSTFKAIEKKDNNEQQRWLLYWAARQTIFVYFSHFLISLRPEKKSILACSACVSVLCGCFWCCSVAYGSFSLVEVFADKLISWVPMYYHVKFAFLVWLQLPSGDGAKQLYTSHLRPFFLRHQARIDQFLGITYREMVCLSVIFLVSFFTILVLIFPYYSITA